MKGIQDIIPHPSLCVIRRWRKDLQPAYTLDATDLSNFLLAKRLYIRALCAVELMP